MRIKEGKRKTPTTLKRKTCWQLRCMRGTGTGRKKKKKTMMKKKKKKRTSPCRCWKRRLLFFPSEEGHP